MMLHKQYKKLSAIFFVLCGMQCTFTWADIYIDFYDDGKVVYSLHGTKKKNTTLQVNHDWKIIKEKINGTQTSFFKTKFLKDESCYELESVELIPETEDVYLRIPRDYSVKFTGDMHCHSLALREAYPRKLGGTFTNTGHISFMDTDKDIQNRQTQLQSIKKYGLHFEHNTHFQNENKLTFERKTLLSLSNGFITNENKALIEFAQEARLVENKIIKSKNKFLLFSEDDSTPLVNNGHIKGLKKLGLFVKCFISGTGRIQANSIIMDWDGRQSFSFANNLKTAVPLTTEDSNFPILDIVRIPETLQYTFNAGGLGEEAACHLYRTFMKKKCFSHKSNNQENGIDIIAYNNKNKKQLIVHESKNYNHGSFTLGNNQMTQSWVYGYLFRMYQDFLKENIYQLTTNDRKLSEVQYNNIKNVLLNILHTDDLKDLKMLITWVNNKTTSEKEKKYIITAINKVRNMEASTMTLNDYKAYFSDDLQIFARGNSIVHCELPTTTQDWGSEEEFKKPTYCIRRNLTKTFNEKGVIPKPNG